jgi:hypothetical protein
MSQVKCDERPGGCTNCERLGLPCASYYTTAPGRETRDIPRLEKNGEISMPNQTSDLLRRKRDRIYRACVECRTSKTKCNGLKPSCTRCQQRKIKCVYEHSSQSLPAWAHRLAMRSNPVPTTGMALSRDEPGDIETVAVTHGDIGRSTSPNPLHQETAPTPVDNPASILW